MSWRIRTVSAETGVAPMTLRAWERRYGFPKPERTDQNYRTYNAEEVEKLRRVVALISSGLSVSEAVARVQGDANAPGVDPATLIARFFAAAAALDDAKIEDVLEIVLRDLSPAQACDEVLLPLLRDMTNHLDIAREHVASRAIRSAIIRLAVAGKRRSKRTPILLACPAGEEHEGGLLGLAVHLRLHGERTVMLGANTPTEALAAACEQLKPAALCLSAINHRSPQELTTLLTEITTECKVPLVIVGGAFAREHLKHVFAAGADFAADANEMMKKLP